MGEASWRTVTETAERLEAEEAFSGILRVTRGDEVLHESCHGFANRGDGIPVRPTTRFATASLSKMFTAVGVLDAVGRGEVGLHDAVVDVLPPDRRPTTLREDVSVHHLLSHTSGIADYFEEDEDLPGHREDMDDIWATLPNYTVRDYVALLPLFADLPPVCPPGSAYHYSNAGFVLLGLLLATVSGLPFTEAVETRVLAPAGMTASGYPAFDEVHADVAQGYLPPLTDGGPWRTNIYSVHPVGGGDGGAVVTAQDVEVFLRALHRGGVWRGVTPQLVLTPRVRAEGRWSSGYGVDVRDDGVFGKDGGDPGVAAVSRYRPGTDTTVVLLANVDWDTVPGLPDLANLLIGTALDD
ncbi:serine hydrolase domain-containing protein [Ornithinimicrobium cerasi]|uniref:CubicO group peptidase, beta-lactamase class C family n=1 Tax=Ornithinimicrobium cerasi TaxID=2248773 RepID=A0A285VEW1_9MICO|nr:serine hydrolase domain-containing protein [Ornithinimicrobium cerasi]SOC52497.1 CubicO group peptidase, beta-lactamase class C family [Ornithinimicrobium cerasi]